MANTDSKTQGNVVDFAKAREARIRRARPLQGRLLMAVATRLDPQTRAAFNRAVAEGIIEGIPTHEILRGMGRDFVRQAANAATI